MSEKAAEEKHKSLENYRSTPLQITKKPCSLESKYKEMKGGSRVLDSTVATKHERK